MKFMVVDDCSRDTTFSKLLALQKRYPKLKILKHKINSGQSASVLTGVRHAKFIGLRPWMVMVKTIRPIFLNFLMWLYKK